MFLGTNRGQRRSEWEFVIESPRHKFMAVPRGEKLCIINATIKGHHVYQTNFPVGTKFTCYMDQENTSKQIQQYRSCGKERGNYCRTCSRGLVSVLVSHSRHIPWSSDFHYLNWCALGCIRRQVDCWWGCGHPVEVHHRWKNFLQKGNPSPD